RRGGVDDLVAGDVVWIHHIAAGVSPGLAALQQAVAVVARGRGGHVALVVGECNVGEGQIAGVGHVVGIDDGVAYQAAGRAGRFVDGDPRLGRYHPGKDVGRVVLILARDECVHRRIVRVVRR